MCMVKLRRQIKCWWRRIRKKKLFIWMSIENKWKCRQWTRMVTEQNENLLFYIPNMFWEKINLFSFFSYKLFVLLFFFHHYIRAIFCIRTIYNDVVLLTQAILFYLVNSRLSLVGSFILVYNINYYYYFSSIIMALYTHSSYFFFGDFHKIIKKK